MGTTTPAGGRRRGLGGMLRQRRVAIAGVLALAEVLLLALGRTSTILVLAVAVGAVALHLYVGPRLPYALRQVTWTLALAQVLVALFAVIIGVAIVAFFAVLVVLVIGGLMMLLADRK